MTQEKQVQIKCPHCGKELPEGASFCPYCEKKIIAEQQMNIPRKRSKKMLALAGILLMLAAAAFFVLRLYHRPKVYEGGAELTYEVDGKPCKVLLSFHSSTGETGIATESASDRQAAGNSAMIPSQLFVYQYDDTEIQQLFVNQVKKCTVTAVPRDGALAMDVSEPLTENEIGSPAAWTAHVTYAPANGTNDILWTLEMKNGDTLRLQHAFTCELQEVLDYHYEDTPLESIEQIEALIGKVTEEEAPDTIVNLYLPPVTYEGELTLDKRSVNLYGSATKDGATTFTGTVTVSTRNPNVPEFFDINFSGDGGTGLSAHEGIWMQHCTFTGWDTGADAQNGSWIMMEDCTFENNGVGFCFNSREATCSSPEYYGLVFRDNATGIRIVQVPGDIPLRMNDCTFSGNQTDIEDPDQLVELIRP